MNRRQLLCGGLSLVGLGFVGSTFATPARDFSVQLAKVDNAIDATKLLGFNRAERIFVLGLNPHQFRSFDDVRTYAIRRGQLLFERAELLVGFRQEVIDQFGADVVAAAMDSRNPWNAANGMFRKLVQDHGFHEGFLYRDYDYQWEVGYDDIFYGDLRPVIV